MRSKKQRKKKLEKGISSLEEQIEIHEAKREEALKQGKNELAEYYNKEIGSWGTLREKKSPN